MAAPTIPPLPQSLAPKPLTGNLAALMSNLGAARGGPSVPFAMTPAPSYAPAPVSLPGGISGSAAMRGGTMPSLAQTLLPEGVNGAAALRGGSMPNLAGLAGQAAPPPGATGATNLNPFPRMNLRNVGTQVKLGSPGFRAGLGRLGLGLGIHYAGNAAADAMGGQDTAAGRTTQAATLGGSVGSAFGAPGAAVGAAGMGLGQGAYELVSEGDNSIANVGTNISRALGSYGPGSFGAAVDMGVDPVAVVNAMRDGDESSVVMQIVDAYGVEPDADGGYTLEGDALKALEAAREMTQPDSDDPFGKLMYDLAESGADDEEIQATIDTYGAMLAEDPEADPATVASQARDYVTSQKEALVAENQAAESRLAEIAAFQQQVQQYMAPVTGGMRQRADLMRESTQQTLANANLPSGMAAGLQMQMDAQYQGQMAMADAYDRQIAITPSMVMQQEAQAQTSALADQLLQAMYVQPAVNQMTQPQATGLEGINPAMLEMLPQFDDGGVVPGPVGKPKLAVVHGGETVLPTHKKDVSASTGKQYRYEVPPDAPAGWVNPTTYGNGGLMKPPTQFPMAHRESPGFAGLLAKHLAYGGKQYRYEVPPDAPAGWENPMGSLPKPAMSNGAVWGSIQHDRLHPPQPASRAY